MSAPDETTDTVADEQPVDPGQRRRCLWTLGLMALGVVVVDQLVKAWVVVREGYQVTVEDLRAYCRERLTGYKVPKHVEFRDSLPKTMVGKVLRRMLVKGETGQK